MTELLILGRTILAQGPLQKTTETISAPDGVFPKHVIEGWAIVEAELPDDFSCASYEWNSGPVRKPPIGKTEEQLREEFKARRTAAVASILVDVDGLQFDGDETSQGRMARAIIALNAAGVESTVWVLANNEPVSVSVEQLSRALVLAGLEQSRLWVEA
jgi:hypothetical protein